MHKKTKKIALFVILSLSLSPLKVFATDLQDQINSNNQQKNELENQKENIEKLSEGANKELQIIKEKAAAKGIEVTESSVKVQSFQTKIDELQGQIDELQGTMNKAQTDIDAKQKLIEKEEQESQERQDMLGNRLRSYYKNDMNSQTLYVILKSESITDLISNIMNVSKLLNIDQKLLKEIQETKEKLANEKVSLQKQVDKLSEEKAQIKSKQQEQVDAQKEFLDEKNNYEEQMQELQTIEKAKDNVAKSLTQKEKEIEDKIGDIDSYNQDLQNQIDKIFNDINNNPTTDPNISNGEGFLKPAVGGISSYYGPRIHPITGANGFHTGIDIAAENKSNIVASKSGAVVFAGVQSGYGNVVIVDHGGGIQTLYAHCSSILVSYGQKVSRGQMIAKIGSTGNSTGPHLHFEVRVNGVHKDPMNYL